MNYTSFTAELRFKICKVKKVKGKEAYSYKHRTATGTHVPYGIIQYYLPSGRGDIPAFTPAN